MDYKVTVQHFNLSEKLCDELSVVVSVKTLFMNLDRFAGVLYYDGRKVFKIERFKY